MKQITTWILVLLISTAAPLVGQGSLKDAMESLSQNAAQQYVKPVTAGFGSNLNTGWFHRAPKASKFGFNVEFGMVFMGTMFNKKDKSFSSTTTLDMTETDADFIATTLVNNDPTLSQLPNKDQAIDAIAQQLLQQFPTMDVTIAGATFIGNKNDKIRITYGTNGTITYNNQTYQLEGRTDTSEVGGILNAPLIPLFAPQITVGTIMGTQLTLRYLPPIKVDKKVGTLKYTGFGIQHNPQVWFGKVLPLDLAASFYTQSIKQGDLFEATGTAYGVTASKQFGFRLLNLTPYAGFLIESSEMKFKYDYVYELEGVEETAHISFKQKGANTSRFTVGTNIRFLVVNINADYSFAKNPAYSLGVNFAL